MFIANFAIIVNFWSVLLSKTQPVWLTQKTLLWIERHWTAGVCHHRWAKPNAQKMA
jgi:hypothetical protein